MKTMKNTIKLIGLIALVAVIGFSMAVCSNGSTGGGGGGKKTSGTTTGGNVSVTFSGVTHNGSELARTTTQLTLTFSQAITGLTANDITLNYSGGVAKGTLSGSGPIYILPITINPRYILPDDFDFEGSYSMEIGLDVAVAKSGYSISGSPKTLDIYYHSYDDGQGVAPTITTSSLPNGTVRTAYSQTLAATGDAPITWTIESGALPAGLSLAATGTISGTPTAAGTSTFTVMATNAAGIGIKQFSITIATAGSGNQTPVASDYTFGKLSQTAGSVTAVTITPKSGKSPGAISNIRYSGNAAIPQTAGTYAVTFNVAAATGWNAATGLSAGNLVVTPVALPPTGGLQYTLLGIGLSYEVSAGTVTGGPVVIPSEYNGKPVTQIAVAAFRNLNITSVTIPNSVTTIGEYAFGRCTGLTSITIPNSVTTIGQSAFESCTGLTSITIPNSVTTIGGMAFFDCSGLKSVAIGSGVKIIDIGTFGICTGLTSVTLGSSVTTIDSIAFESCTSLTSITIPNSVTSIHSRAFVNCNSLTSITVASGNTTYRSEGNCMIRRADNTLVLGCKTSVIPNGVTSIGEYAFAGCTGLTGVINTFPIPNSVTSIGRYAFAATALTSITIPNSVTTIGDYAFFGSSLTGVIFATGSNILTANFGDNAFPEGSGSGGNSLRTAYLAANPKAGTYTRPTGGSWTKQ